MFIVWNMNHMELVDLVRQTGFEVHVYFKSGFLEKVYENSLCNRLRKKGIKVEQQVPLKVFDDDGSIVGEYIADLLIENLIIVELKAIQTLTNVQTAQILAYLKASEISHGILMNFGNSKFQIKKYIL